MPKPGGETKCLKTQSQDLRKKYSETARSICLKMGGMLQNAFTDRKPSHEPAALLLSTSVGQASRNQPETTAKENQEDEG